MTVLFGFIAAIAGSVLIGYSIGLRARKLKHAAKDMQMFEGEAAQSVDRSMEPAADRVNVPGMEPVTDHERAISEAVDKKFTENPSNRQPTIRDYLDISASIDFVMSAGESQFLIDYLRWRLTHTIKPAQSKKATKAATA